MSQCEVESGGCELKTPRKAPNEANLESTQSTYSQEVESENADPERRERSQSAAAGRVVQAAASQDVVPDEQCLPIVGTQHGRAPDATPAKRPITSLSSPPSHSFKSPRGRRVQSQGRAITGSPE